MANFPSKLIEGHERFQAGKGKENRKRYETLAEKGQKPEIMVISCCDSRVSPETIFDAEPGEIFVARNVANLVTAHSAERNDVAAAVEFASLHLGVEHIIVLGHSGCGGVEAMRQGRKRQKLSPEDCVGRWISAFGELEAENPRDCEWEAIRRSVDNLRNYPLGPNPPKLHGAWFDVTAGELWIMGGQGGFAPLRGS